MKKIIAGRTFKAFTLSELLIALSIVGVIAVLTVPNVMRNLTESSNIVKLQSTHKTLFEAVNKLLIDERTTNVEDTIIMTDPNSFFRDYLNVSKICNKAEDCFVTNYSSINKKNNNIGTGGMNSTSIMAHGILNTGAAVAFYAVTPCSGCTSVGYFQVDVNGKLGPNVLGRDFFSIELQKDGELSNKWDGYWKTPKEACLNGELYATSCFWLLEKNRWNSDY